METHNPSLFAMKLIGCSATVAVAYVVLPAAVIG